MKDMLEVGDRVAKVYIYQTGQIEHISAVIGVSDEGFAILTDGVILYSQAKIRFGEAIFFALNGGIYEYLLVTPSVRLRYEDQKKLKWVDRQCFTEEQKLQIYELFHPNKNQPTQ